MSANSEQYLQAWHTRYPDAGAMFLEARDDAGQSSLDRLVHLVPPGATVLDLACGAGNLIVALEQSRRTRRAFGIDLTLPELSIARDRAQKAHFSRGRAQQLPFRDGSLDCVLCHMALMLFDDIDGVLNEVARVLRPGGIFGAVTNSATEVSPAGVAIVKSLKSRRQMSDQTRLAPALGDPRVQDADRLGDLVGAHFARVRVTSFVITQAVPRDSLWRYLTHAAYGLDAFPDAVGAEVLDSLDFPDPVQWQFPMLLVEATRS